VCARTRKAACFFARHVGNHKLIPSFSTPLVFGARFCLVTVVVAAAGVVIVLIVKSNDTIVLGAPTAAAAALDKYTDEHAVTMARTRRLSAGILARQVFAHIVVELLVRELLTFDDKQRRTPSDAAAVVNTYWTNDERVQIVVGRHHTVLVVETRIVGTRPALTDADVACTLLLDRRDQLHMLGPAARQELLHAKPVDGGHPFVLAVLSGWQHAKALVNDVGAVHPTVARQCGQ
jgi:hypothetical protein